MSTGSYIIYRDDWDNYHYRQIHYDGYLRAQGNFLLKHYKKHNNVKKLVNCNDSFRTLCTTKLDIIKNVNQRYQNVKDAYNYFEIDSAVLLGNREENIKNCYKPSYDLVIKKIHESYIYLYENKKWHFNNDALKNSDSFQDLDIVCNAYNQIREITKSIEVRDYDRWIEIPYQIQVQICNILKPLNWQCLCKEDQLINKFSKEINSMINNVYLENILEAKNELKSKLKI